MLLGGCIRDSIERFLNLLLRILFLKRVALVLRGISNPELYNALEEY